MTAFTMDLNLVQSKTKVRLGCRPGVVQSDSGSSEKIGTTETLTFDVFGHSFGIQWLLFSQFYYEHFGRFALVGSQPHTHMYLIRPYDHADESNE